jgi:hypothetical protein
MPLTLNKVCLLIFAKLGSMGEYKFEDFQSGLKNISLKMDEPKFRK